MINKVRIAVGKRSQNISTRDLRRYQTTIKNVQRKRAFVLPWEPKGLWERQGLSNSAAKRLVRLKAFRMNLLIIWGRFIVGVIFRLCTVVKERDGACFDPTFCINWKGTAPHYVSKW